MMAQAYKDAGVDIDAGNTFAGMVKERIARAWPGTEREIGRFAGQMPIPGESKEFCGSVDGTGTKAIVAALAGNFAGLGQDAVAMGAVDAYVAGFQPTAVMDTLAVGKLDRAAHIKIIDSVIRGCQMAGAHLIGGETAELPGMFRHTWMVNLDVAVIGFPDKRLALEPIATGDVVYGWPSYGLGSNGFSLVRRVFRLDKRPSRARIRLCRIWPELNGALLSDVLLRPTPIWIPWINSAIAEGVKFSGHAHITGGGLVENIPRILPNNLKVVLYRSSWQVDPIFWLIQRLGKVSLEEMERVFNMGLMIVSTVKRTGKRPKIDGAKAIGHVMERTGDEPQVQLMLDYKQTI
ncbi:phosphoribosylformylglycinamidine cyclo-ligase [Patescibacteria group bacterium]|nr:phosphoribosylformylglycinamidine cyclo-ligase [Patescibacteria group bacterium]MBU1951555.1 phosphoribosylformylglycinamidine cyclo-ligase [Patescibacteria group bacterium]